MWPSTETLGTLILKMTDERSFQRLQTKSLNAALCKLAVTKEKVKALELL